MLTAFLLLCLIPLAWALVMKFVFKRQVVWWEMLLTFLGGMAVTAIGLSIAFASTVSDHEILNGRVTSKVSEIVPCSHSYPCHCRSTKNGTKCDTCYEHPFDKEWLVKADVGTVEISTIDSQGLIEPPRWHAAKVGEPFAEEHRYVNWLLAAKDSLFHDRGVSGAKYAIPAYREVYDYYRFDHATAIGAAVPNIKVWNDAINKALERLGSEKQININLMFVDAPPEFGQALEANWVGGKKNDLNIIVGIDKWPNVSWVYPFTYANSSGNELVTVEVRDLLLRKGELDDPVKAVNDVVAIAQRDFHRKPMSNFAYLASEIAPSMLAIILIIVFMIAALVGMTYVFVNNDATTKPNRFRRYFN